MAPSLCCGGTQPGESVRTQRDAPPWSGGHRRAGRAPGTSAPPRRARPLVTGSGSGGLARASRCRSRRGVDGRAPACRARRTGRGRAAGARRSAGTRDAGARPRRGLRGERRVATGRPPRRPEHERVVRWPPARPAPGSIERTIRVSRPRPAAATPPAWPRTACARRTPPSSASHGDVRRAAVGDAPARRGPARTPRRRIGGDPARGPQPGAAEPLDVGLVAHGAGRDRGLHPGRVVVRAGGRARVEQQSSSAFTGAPSP